MKKLFKLIILTLIISSCSKKPEETISYIGPFSPEEFSVRKVISDYQSGVFDYDVFSSDWKIETGNVYKWKEAEYIINPVFGNNQ